MSKGKKSPKEKDVVFLKKFHKTFDGPMSTTEYIRTKKRFLKSTKMTNDQFKYRVTKNKLRSKLNNLIIRRTPKEKKEYQKKYYQKKKRNILAWQKFYDKHNK